jgi:phosphoglucomutase
MIIAEMAAYYYSRGMSLYDGLQEIYKKYGYFIETITSYTLEGKEGIEKIKGTLLKLREDNIIDFNGSKVVILRDYLSGQKYIVSEGKREPLDLPKSDVLYYEMQDGSWFCIRPSGTEPKIKIYFGVSDSNKNNADKKMNVLKENVLEVINKLLK